MGSFLHHHLGASIVVFSEAIELDFLEEVVKEGYLSQDCAVS